MLNPDQNLGLPEGETPFVASKLAYTGNFVKIALNVARRAGDTSSVLPDLPRSWFGADAGQPGTAHFVELVAGVPDREMRPVSTTVTPHESVG